MTYRGSRRSGSALVSLVSLLPLEVLPQKNQVKVVTNRSNMIVPNKPGKVLYLFNILNLQNTYVPPVNRTYYHFSHLEFYTCEPTKTIYFLKRKHLSDPTTLN